VDGLPGTVDGAFEDVLTQIAGKADTAQVEALDAVDKANYAKSVEMIAHDATAPSPVIPTGTTKTYEFSSGGNCTMFTAGAQVVEKGDKMTVAFTAPSTFIRTFLGVTSNYATRDSLTKNFNDILYTEGYYINTSNGSLLQNASYRTSNYLPIKSNTLYKLNNSHNVCFFDFYKAFISGLSNSGGEVTTPSNAVYIRFSTTNAVGVTVLYPSDLALKKSDVEISILESYTIDRDLNVIYGLTGKYYHTNGVLMSGALYASTELFKVAPSSVYTVTGLFRAVLYDSNKAFIGYFDGANGTLSINTTASTYYMALTVTNANKSLSRAYSDKIQNNIDTVDDVGFDVNKPMSQKGTKAIITTALYDINKLPLKSGYVVSETIGAVIKIIDSASYEYAIFSCRKGMKFYTKGLAQYSTRTWAILTYDYKVLRTADAGLFDGYVEITGNDECYIAFTSETSLADRIFQLTNINDVIVKNYTPNSYKYNLANRPIISFVDDDTLTVANVQLAHTNWTNAGIKGVFACITKKLGDQVGLSDLLNTYEKEGHQCVYHCYDQIGDYYTTGRDTAIVENDFVRGLKDMQLSGFSNWKYWVTPGGAHDEWLRRLAMKWGMKGLFNAKGSYNSLDTTNRFDITRQKIDGLVDGTTSLQTIKNIIDGCINNNGWLIMYSHQTTDSQWVGNNVISDLVSYIDNRAEIVTIGEVMVIKDITLQ
jgi:hypothetical protein